MADELEHPSLDSDESVLIAAFEGWNDAGGAASSAVDHMIRSWKAREYAALDPEDYHDFQVNRPSIGRGSSGERVVSWPGTVISTVESEWPTQRAMALVQGIEPSMRWRQFCAEILDYAEDLEISTLISCGSLLVDVPHTRPLPVFVTSESKQARKRFDLERSDYEGPTGILGVLGHEAALRNITVLSMWVGVPHYVAHPPSPKATLALLSAIERYVGQSIDLADLPYEAEAWQRGVDALMEDDSDIADHVRQLEEAMDVTDAPEASGDAIAEEFERFLRRRDQPGRKDS